MLFECRYTRNMHVAEMMHEQRCYNDCHSWASFFIYNNYLSSVYMTYPAITGPMLQCAKKNTLNSFHLSYPTAPPKRLDMKKNESSLKKTFRDHLQAFKSTVLQVVGGKKISEPSNLKAMMPIGPIIQFRKQICSGPECSTRGSVPSASAYVSHLPKSIVSHWYTYALKEFGDSFHWYWINCICNELAIV